jgi:hypothetical protein
VSETLLSFGRYSNHRVDVVQDSAEKKMPCVAGLAFNDQMLPGNGSGTFALFSFVA